MNRQTTEDTADLALYETLNRAGGLDQLDPAEDLVARATRRLPAAPPRAALRRSVWRRALLRGGITFLLALVVMPAIAGALALLRGGETPLAQLASSEQNGGRGALLAATFLSPDAPLTRALTASVIWLGQVIAVTLAVGLWPRRSAAAGWALARQPLPALGIGIPAALALAAAAAALLALLTATLAGLPIAVVMLLLAQAPFVLGLAVGARIVGTRALGRLTPSAELDIATITGAALLALPAALAGALAITAVPPVFYLMAAPGLGALILSQGGMRATA